jgi:hypothetical protein
LAPVRVLDTRTIGAVVAGAVVHVNVSDAIPAGASAVAVNVTVAQATNAGYWTVWPTGLPQPVASNVNVEAGDTVANTVIVPVGADGTVSVYSLSGGQLLVDVVGWFTGASDAAGTDGLLETFTQPVRVVDTRIGLGSNRLVAHDLTVPVTAASGVVGNLTWVAPAQPGYLTVWPSGTARPIVSTANPDPNLADAWSNAMISGEGVSGVQVWSLRPTDLLVDLVGVFT